MHLPAPAQAGIRPVPFVRDLAAHGDRTALITADGELSYRELAARVSESAGQLGSGRRLVLLAGANRTEALVGYLAALAAGHPLLLVPGGSGQALRSLTAAYDPDVVLTADGAGGLRIEERRADPSYTAHELHPELALLLSTSGSTGSPKLVRLSQENLQSNAAAIASYLGIRESDRAATTLPVHYCYGLSVVNSHLLRGAALVLTELSVADTCFWDLFRTARATTLAGVPYTFDLLDRVGFASMELPHLRYVTQAGGRLAPERVRRFAELGRERGWDLFVMYGQTEATARMAYLPPDLAAAHPTAIGVPIPGGEFRLAAPEAGADTDSDSGELVYTGANVMLGYATAPADLALGRTVHELRTGDLARRTPEGLYEITGRSSRFAKILGLRIDPQRVEGLLAEHGISALCAGGDGELLIAARTAAPHARRVRRLVAEECGLPPRAIRVRCVAELPRLASGKPDYAAVRAHAAPDPSAPAAADAPHDAPPEAAPGSAAGLRALYGQILDLPPEQVPAHGSFTSLGGDSLSYVELSVRLEQALGRLPEGWHLRTIAELAAADGEADQGAARGRIREIETGVLLRAVGIVLIVGTHIPLFRLPGGAHVLLGVAGYNFARFLLTSHGARERARRIRASVLRVVVPSTLCITLTMLTVREEYQITQPLLLASVLGPYDTGSGLNYWFVEALVYFLTALAALLCVPLLDRAERRFPFAFPLAVTALGIALHHGGFTFGSHKPHLAPLMVFWIFALGWAAARATRVSQRLVLTLAVVVTVPGLFDVPQPQRALFIVAGLALLIWVPRLPGTKLLNRAAAVLASSSLYVYLTHYAVFPLFTDPLAGLLASLAVGIGYARLAAWVPRRIGAIRRGGGGATAFSRLRACPTAIRRR
ncbi:AMP-binding protein [Streptomyces polyrhachis]|uniref:AMP-binding protein n=1 Tax=Streptomyces polyrhachis TaxID=1282885 RepID=A0ABW2GG31_9ACTN